VLSGEATNTNSIAFDLTQSGLEPTIYALDQIITSLHQSFLILSITDRSNLLA